MTRVSWKTVGELALVAAMGCAPLWWFYPGDLMKSTDLRLPTAPAELGQFLYAWKDQVGAGAESIFDASLLLFHGLEALCFRWLGGGFSAAQQAVFWFWFLLSGFSVYALLRVVLTGAFRRAGRLVGVSFYLFNLWQASYWTAYKPPLVAGYAVLPGFLAALILALEGRLQWRIAIPMLGGLSVLASPIGNNPTEAVGFLLPILGCVALYGWRCRWAGQGRALIWLGLTIIVLNAFWWVPQVGAGFHQWALNPHVAAARDNAANWLEGLSARTSFANVARLQGEWTWGSGVWELYVPYSLAYQKTLLLQAAGWLIPALALAGAMWGQQRHKAFFMLIAVVGLVLSMGIHSPFRASYLAMTRWVPGFWMLRSPYYKFGMMLCLGYAFFLGVAAALMCRWLAGRWRPALAAATIVVGGIGLNAVYAFPVTTGEMFIPPAQRHVLPPGRVRLPDYVAQAAEWLSRQPGWFRVWTVSGDTVWQTRWGYGGIGSVLHDLSQRPLIFPYDTTLLLTTQGARHPIVSLVNPWARGLWEQRSQRIAALGPLLNAQYLLVEDDVAYPTYERTGRDLDRYVSFTRAHVEAQGGVRREAMFGPWTFYRVRASWPHLWAGSTAWIIYGTPQLLLPWAYTDSLEHPTAVCFAEETPDELQTQWIQAGFVRGVVVEATQPFPEVARRAMDQGAMADLVWTMQQAPVMPLASAPALESPVTPWAWPQGFTDPERRSDGRRWRWVTNTTTNAIEVTNPQPSPVRAAFKLAVLSADIERSMMLYWNDALFSAFPIPPDRPVLVTTPAVELAPGRNTLRLYTPSPPTPHEGQPRTFAVAESPSTHGSGVLEQRIAVPKTGIYQWWCAPVRPGPQAAPQRLSLPAQIDGRAVALPLGSLGDVYGPVEITLTAGTHLVQIPQETYEEYQCVLRWPSQSAAASLDVPADATRLSPVAYRGRVRADGPHLLVFQESFDQRWVALANGHPIGRHVMVQGYANGWWVDHAGSYEVAIRFLPQRWMWIGAAISVVGGIIVLGAIRRWR